MNNVSLQSELRELKKNPPPENNKDRFWVIVLVCSVLAILAVGWLIIETI